MEHRPGEGDVLEIVSSTARENPGLAWPGHFIMTLSDRLSTGVDKIPRGSDKKWLKQQGIQVLSSCTLVVAFCTLVVASVLWIL